MRTRELRTSIAEGAAHGQLAVHAADLAYSHETAKGTDTRDFGVIEGLQKCKITRLEAQWYGGGSWYLVVS
jgi:hypothetical protein